MTEKAKTHGSEDKIRWKFIKASTECQKPILKYGAIVPGLTNDNLQDSLSQIGGKNQAFPNTCNDSGRQRSGFHYIGDTNIIFAPLVSHGSRLLSSQTSSKSGVRGFVANEEHEWLLCRYEVWHLQTTPLSPRNTRRLVLAGTFPPLSPYSS